MNARQIKQLLAAAKMAREWLSDWGNTIEIATGEQCNPWPIFDALSAALDALDRQREDARP